MKSFENALRKWIEENPEKVAQLNQPPEESQSSLVDSVIKTGEDPNFANEPEDRFGLTKQLNTITKLRKDGWDNARIFKAMELEEAEAESTKQPEPNNTPEKPTPEPAMYAQSKINQQH